MKLATKLANWIFGKQYLAMQIVFKHREGLCELAEKTKLKENKVTCRWSYLLGGFLSFFLSNNKAERRQWNEWGDAVLVLPSFFCLARSHLLVVLGQRYNKNVCFIIIVALRIVWNKWFIATFPFKHAICFQKTPADA